MKTDINFEEKNATSEILFSIVICMYTNKNMMHT